MDLEEYEKRLLSEPRSDEPEAVEARRASTAHAAAYRAAQAFEDKLEAALKLPVAPDAAERIIERCLPRRSRAPVWIALAASLAVAAVVAVWLVPSGPSAADLEIRLAFVEHLGNPEPALESERAVDPAQVRAAFAGVGVDLVDPLGNVTYLSPCVIGGRQGLHLVLTGAEGAKTTLMMLPGQHLTAAAEFNLPGISARLERTDMGAIALFGHRNQDLDALSREVLANVAPLLRTALLDL